MNKYALYLAAVLLSWVPPIFADEPAECNLHDGNCCPFSAAQMRSKCMATQRGFVPISISNCNANNYTTPNSALSCCAQYYTYCLRPEGSTGIQAGILDGMRQAKTELARIPDAPYLPVPDSDSARGNNALSNAPPPPLPEIAPPPPPSPANSNDSSAGESGVVNAPGAGGGGRIKMNIQ